MEDFIPAIKYWMERRCVKNRAVRSRSSDLYADYVKFIPKIPDEFLFISMSKVMFTRVFGKLNPYIRIGGISFFYGIMLRD